MDSRQQQLLNLVVESHIDTAEPVGSKFLVSVGGLDWSEATIRNDLRALEDAGYLTHPHTSAGRIPTEQGYRFYLDNLDLSKEKISKKDNDVLGMSIQVESGDLKNKNLAKAIVELSGETVIMAEAPEKVYYTGLSNLFSQPEFRALDMVADLSQVFDHCEECLASFYNNVGLGVKNFVGQEHSFGSLLSVIAFRFGDEGVFVLLGPMRMNYRHNWALINKVKELI